MKNNLFISTVNHFLKRIIPGKKFNWGVNTYYRHWYKKIKKCSAGKNIHILSTEHQISHPVYLENICLTQSLTTTHIYTVNP